AAIGCQGASERLGPHGDDLEWGERARIDDRDSPADHVGYVDLLIVGRDRQRPRFDSNLDLANLLVQVVADLQDRDRVVFAIDRPDEPVIGRQGDGTGAGRGATSSAGPVPGEQGQGEGELPRARTDLNSLHRGSLMWPINGTNKSKAE